MTKQELIVEEARKWLGTPYHHQADVFGFGVDCAMLLVRVAVDTGLCAPFDPRPYPVDWHHHRDDERFLGIVEKYADKVPEGEPPQPGDIPLFQYARCMSHGGIVEVVEPEPIMIHASLTAGKVERAEVRGFEDRLRGYWRIRE